MKQKRNYQLYLKDILDSMIKIRSYIKGHNYNSFTKNNMLIDAVIRNFEIIGEAVKHIPEEFKEKYKYIPWRKMNSLRNFLSHEYFGVDYSIIWKIAYDELPTDIENIKKSLKEFKKAT